jgi:hypothetical protein
MDEPIDESDDTGGVREDLVPFAERFVGRKHQWAAQLVTARDHLEQQVRVTRVIGQVSNFIHAQYGWSGVAAQPPCQLREPGVLSAALEPSSRGGLAAGAPGRSDLPVDRGAAGCGNGTSCW